ncbi:hypothetical protein [Haloarcula sp. JP-L23]|uniref:hypothetical protein n=1 Tax=Haloarcula sp. JP-L23 TaxID=2716717 RepID=UPI00140F4090|nr:hypothetical protein G9465_22965 [Haloarcula sp. JP-L23]
MSPSDSPRDIQLGSGKLLAGRVAAVDVEEMETCSTEVMRGRTTDGLVPGLWAAT